MSTAIFIKVKCQLECTLLTITFRVDKTLIKSRKINKITKE